MAFQMHTSIMHHAQLLVGTFETVASSIPKEDKEVGPDVLVLSYDRFGIGDARELKEHASSKPFSRAFRTFIIVVRSATIEAQNALLKLLEDPVATTRFYIIVPNEDILLATVKSRLQISSVRPLRIVENSGFTSLSVPDRLDLIATYAKDKNMAALDALFNEIEVYAGETHNVNLMNEVVFVRSYDRATGASKKMLLEHLAITCP